LSSEKNTFAFILLLCYNSYNKELDMLAVQAYYNGHAFIPLEDKVFALNQPAMIVVADPPVSSSEHTSYSGISAECSNPNQQRIETAKSLFGILSNDVTLEEAQAERLSQI
jgi:hypothetical protein